MKLNEYLGASLQYDLKCKLVFGPKTELPYYYEQNEGHLFTLEGMMIDWYPREITSIVPIVRSLSDLTKPIIQKDYNNGEPFVPALELIKLEEKYNKWVDNAPTIPYDIEIIKKPYGKVLKISKLGEWVTYLSFSEIERAKYYVIQFLIKLHFDLLDEGIEKVFTDEFNPY